MSEKILISSDSTTDLSPELRAQYGVELMRMVVNLNEIDYVDGVDITPDDIYRNYEENRTLPKTSAPETQPQLQPTQGSSSTPAPSTTKPTETQKPVVASNDTNEDLKEQNEDSEEDLP